jgi:hypothetical protein
MGVAPRDPSLGEAVEAFEVTPEEDAEVRARLGVLGWSDLPETGAVASLVAFGALATMLVAAGAASHQAKILFVQLYQRGIEIVPPGYDVLPMHQEATRELVEPAFLASFGKRLGPWLLSLALSKGWRYQTTVAQASSTSAPATAGSMMTMPSMPLVRRMARRDLGRGGGGGGGHGGGGHGGGSGHGWGPRSAYWGGGGYWGDGWGGFWPGGDPNCVHTPAGVYCRVPTSGAEEEVKMGGPTGDMATRALAQAVHDKSHVPVQWADIPGPDGMTITVATDDLMATPGWSDGPLRLPSSWPEHVAMARDLSAQLGVGVIVASQKIADAIYDAAKANGVTTAFHSLVTPNDPDSGGWKMESADFAKKYNADVNKQVSDKGGAGGKVIAGHQKHWILHRRLSETVKATGRPAAINYGGWDANGRPQQSPGGRHDIDYAGDYSQLFRAVKRMAKAADGSPVDLLAWIEQNENVPRLYTDLFRFPGSDSAPGAPGAAFRST